MQTEDRLARDLDWCLASQPLMSSDAWCAGLAPAGRALKLPAPPHPHHFRLGQHFERLLATWLSASPDHELIANNVQVQDGRRTVGEFDFLVRTRQGVEHWEAAIKFYLARGDGKSLADWYGPNTADRFDIKYERLVSRQLVLSQTEAGQRALRELEAPVTITRCFMKGRLFHPWQRFSIADFQVPRDVNPAHERGFWISYSDFLATFNDLGFRYVYLPKSLWLAPLSIEDITSPLSFFELVEFLASGSAEQATHIAILEGETESCRGFIVSDQWLTRVNAR